MMVIYHVDDVVLRTGRRISAARVGVGRVVVERTHEVDAVVQVHFYRQTVTTELEPAQQTHHQSFIAAE